MSDMLIRIKTVLESQGADAAVKEIDALVAKEKEARTESVASAAQAQKTTAAVADSSREMRQAGQAAAVLAGHSSRGRYWLSELTRAATNLGDEFGLLVTKITLVGSAFVAGWGMGRRISEMLDLERKIEDVMTRLEELSPSFAKLNSDMEAIQSTKLKDIADDLDRGNTAATAMAAAIKGVAAAQKDLLQAEYERDMARLQAEPQGPDRDRRIAERRAAYGLATGQVDMQAIGAQMGNAQAERDRLMAEREQRRQEAARLYDEANQAASRARDASRESGAQSMAPGPTGIWGAIMAPNATEIEARRRLGLPTGMEGQENYEKVRQSQIDALEARRKAELAGQTVDPGGQVAGAIDKLDAQIRELTRAMEVARLGQESVGYQRQGEVGAIDAREQRAADEAAARRAADLRNEEQARTRRELSGATDPRQIYELSRRLAVLEAAGIPEGTPDDVRRARLGNIVDETNAGIRDRIGRIAGERAGDVAGREREEAAAARARAGAFPEGSRGAEPYAREAAIEEGQAREAAKVVEGIKQGYVSAMEKVLGSLAGLEVTVRDLDRRVGEVQRQGQQRP